MQGFFHLAYSEAIVLHTSLPTPLTMCPGLSGFFNCRLPNVELILTGAWANGSNVSIQKSRTGTRTKDIQMGLALDDFVAPFSRS